MQRRDEVNPEGQKFPPFYHIPCAYEQPFPAGVRIVCSHCTQNMITLLKLYLIYMFKVKTLNAGIKGFFASFKEIDLKDMAAGIYRQRGTRREKGDEDRH